MHSGTRDKATAAKTADARRGGMSWVSCAIDTVLIVVALVCLVPIAATIVKAFLRVLTTP